VAAQLVASRVLLSYIELELGSTGAMGIGPLLFIGKLTTSASLIPDSGKAHHSFVRISWRFE
jgi:hypothetical protein